MEKKINVEFFIDEEKLRYITDTKSLGEAVLSEFKGLESDGIRMNDWHDVSDEAEKETRIVVHIDEGGMFQGIYVTPDIAEKNPEVELIDFCTDDSGEEEATSKAYDACIAQERVGKLVVIEDFFQLRADGEEDAEEDDEDE